MADREYLIPMERFDSADYIETRVSDEPLVAGLLRTTLRYLYLSDGPINLPRDRLKASKPFLEPAELVLACWLHTRTNGSERKNYGAPALRAARRQRYRCEHCGHADVRVLHLDHIEGRKRQGDFACLCANCHMLKSRERDWSGRARPQDAG
jgi:hypothetical protein